MKSDYERVKSDTYTTSVSQICGEATTPFFSGCRLLCCCWLISDYARQLLAQEFFHNLCNFQNHYEKINIYNYNDRIVKRVLISRTKHRGASTKSWRRVGKDYKENIIFMSSVVCLETYPSKLLKFSFQFSRFPWGMHVQEKGFAFEWR